MPGEITLAHRGVLFLDEMPEFPRPVLEILRQPLEDRKIVIARTGARYTFPASFLLACAMNPCPCGYYPDLNRCGCSRQMIRAYRQKISRPLLDRIDLSVVVPRAAFEEISRAGDISSADMRREVVRVFGIEKERFAGSGTRFNAEMSAEETAVFCPVTDDANVLLRQAYKAFSLSARGYYRILRTARTIADLDGAETICRAHIEEALFFRNGGEEDL